QNIKLFFQLLYLIYLTIFITFFAAFLLRLFIPAIPHLFREIVTNTVRYFVKDPAMLFWVGLAFVGVMVMFWVMGPEDDHRRTDRIRRGRTLGNLDDLQRRLRTPLAGELNDRNKRSKERRRR